MDKSLLGGVYMLQKYPWRKCTCHRDCESG